MFVSMHTDASDSEQARGVHAIFYARNKSEASAPDSEVCAPRGRALARAVAQEVASALGLPLRNAATGGAAPWWRCPENLTVLTAGENWRKTEAACLVEGGFGSSPEDRAVLSRADAPERYALGVCRGIYRYCGWAYPSVTPEAWRSSSPPAPKLRHRERMGKRSPTPWRGRNSAGSRTGPGSMIRSLVRRRW